MNGAAALHGLTLLLVDDSVDTLETMAMLLQFEGAQVTCARSGSEGLAKASEQRFDVILSDVGMPGMDGYQMIEAIRALPLNGDTPAIALTGYAAEEDAVGFTCHLCKPVEIDDLIRVVRQVASA